MAPSNTPGQTLRSLRAFLVEDEADDRILFANALKRCEQPSQLQTAISADEALVHLAEQPTRPDVIFVDLHLPGRPARELVDWVRSRSEFERVLLIAITGDLKCACISPRELGANAVLVKPISSQDLSAMLTLAEASRES